MESGPAYMSHGGRYLLVGASKGELIFTYPEIHIKETTLICSRNTTLEDFVYVISILEKGKFAIDSSIMHNLDFSEMIIHFDSWLDPKNALIKATINF